MPMHDSQSSVALSHVIAAWPSATPIAIDSRESTNRMRLDTRLHRNLYAEPESKGSPKDTDQPLPSLTLRPAQDCVQDKGQTSNDEEACPHDR